MEFVDFVWFVLDYYLAHQAVTVMKDVVYAQTRDEMDGYVAHQAYCLVEDAYGKKWSAGSRKQWRSFCIESGRSRLCTATHGDQGVATGGSITNTQHNSQLGDPWRADRTYWASWLGNRSRQILL